MLPMRAISYTKLLCPQTQTQTEQQLQTSEPRKVEKKIIIIIEMASPVMTGRVGFSSDGSFGGRNRCPSMVFYG